MRPFNPLRKQRSPINVGFSMPLEIFTSGNRRGLPNLPALVARLRRFRKTSIINTGTHCLWHIYKNPELRQRGSSVPQLIISYAPRIIILAMATANDYRNDCLVPQSLHDLCNDYLGIYDSIGFSAFLDEEAHRIRTGLIEQRNIPEAYIQLEQIRHSCLELSISRLLRSQHETHLTSMEELLRAYRIFEIWDQSQSGRRSEVCRSIFNIDPIHFFRSGFMLFALANDDRRAGHITFRDLTAEDTIINEYQITAETCRLVASRISFNESDLRSWYQQMLEDIPAFYQKFFPVPLYRYPLIHRDQGEREINFLMPSPAFFVRGFVNAFFSQIFENSDMVGFGDAVEEYTYHAICHIFGAANVSRIQDTGEHADFIIRHPECDLIVEVKTTLGGYQEQSMMNPEAVQSLWKLLYKASNQCSRSIRQHRRAEHPTLGIIFIAEHITAEAMPFLSLAERTGMFNDLDVAGIEILPWNSFEHTLSLTSINNFMATLKRKWLEGQRQSAGDLLTFDVERGDAAHSFEHLNETYEQFFPGRCHESAQA